MNALKQFFSILLLSCMCISLHAQQSDSETLLRKLADKYQNARSYTVEFEATTEIPEAEPEVYIGAYTQAGQQFKLSVPNYDIITVDENQWVIDHELKEVMIQTYSWEEQEYELMSPNGILNIHKEESLAHHILFQGEKEGKSVTEIEFKPIERNTAYTKIQLALDHISLRPLHAMVINRDGSRYNLDITKIETNIDPSEALFAFDKTAYSGYFIEDLR